MPQWITTLRLLTSEEMATVVEKMGEKPQKMKQHNEVCQEIFKRRGDRKQHILGQSFFTMALLKFGAGNFCCGKLSCPL